MSKFHESPSQTAGPYVHIGCKPQTSGLEKRTLGDELGNQMVTEGFEGERITLDLEIFDGAGDQVKDALVEIWQADISGTYDGTNGFTHWGRQAADFETGKIHFETAKPGAVGEQSPHILVWIVARGINLGLTTRIYFPDDTSSDPVLKLAGDRASTLISEKTQTGYAHTIYLQGEEETVFFDV